MANAVQPPPGRAVPASPSVCGPSSTWGRLLRARPVACLPRATESPRPAGAWGLMMGTRERGCSVGAQGLLKGQSLFLLAGQFSRRKCGSPA